MEIQIKEVKSKTELKQFTLFPFQLYKNHPHWIPPIIAAEIATFDRKKNPVYEHSDSILLTAWKEDKMVGRIAGLINDMENDFINDKHARFGWIDFVDDSKVCKALIQAIEKWAIQKGMKYLKGPHGFNQLDKNGMLTEGFDSTGTVNSSYNFAYYPEYIRGLGYTPDLEWLEIDMKMPKRTFPRFSRYAKILKEKYQLTVNQPKNKKEMLILGQQVFDLLMATYKNLPGFVPISKKQQHQYINQYIKYLRKDFTVIVYDKKKQPIAFGVTIPSMTKAFKKANGKLFPFGIFHILAARQWNDTADLALIGVTDEWRKKGVHALVLANSSDAVINAGIKRIQITPMQEFNRHVLSLWKDFDQRVYKRRKTFIKQLTVGG